MGAGRRGLDPKGVVILLPNLFDMPESLDLKMMMKDKIKQLHQNLL